MNDEHGSVEDLEQASLAHSIDTILRILSDDRARTTVAYLYSRPDTTLDQLAAVAAGETAAADERIATESDYEQIRLRLYHVTLPRLEAHGWITFDPESGTVSETDIPDPIYEFLGVEVGVEVDSDR